MATFFCSECPRKSRLKENFAPNACAISGVRSEDPESTITTSSTQRTPSRVRGRFFSSFRAIIATETVGMERFSSLIFVGLEYCFCTLLKSGELPDTHPTSCMAETQDRVSTTGHSKLQPDTSFRFR